MSRKAYLDQVPTPPEGIERTRDYIHVFLAALRDLRHDPEHVKQVLREVLDDGGAGESSDED